RGRLRARAVPQRARLARPCGCRAGSRADRRLGMADRLRPLWNFDDLDATEDTLQVQLEREDSDAGRAEVLTQLARVQSLREDFEACEGLLQEAESLAGRSSWAKVRIDLDRGRKLRAGGGAR